VLEPGDERGLVDQPALAFGPHVDPVVLHAALDLPVERREPLLGDLLCVGAADVDLKARAQLLGRDFLRPPAQAVRDVATIQPDLPAAAVHTSDDDVSVGIVGVVVVNRSPLELATEVPLDPGHQAPHVLGEIEIVGILRGDDDAKLMPLSMARLLEGL
jgi:hypothetical protein